MGNYFCAEIKYTSSIKAAWGKTVAIFELLDWNYQAGISNEIRAKTGFSAFGWGETISFSFPKKHRLEVTSESVYPFQVFDLSKNQSNVEKFLEIFMKAKLPLDESEYAYEKHRSFLDRFFLGH